MAEFGKRQRTERVKTNYDGTKCYVFRMIGNTYETCNGNSEKYGAADDTQCWKKQGCAKGVIYIDFIFLALHKPEISCFKGEYNQGKQEWNQGENQTHFAIFHRATELGCQVGC